jgi:hypothetical protein
MASKISVFDDQILYNYMIRYNSRSMAPFNQKHMHALQITNLMVSRCKQELPDHLEEAEALDFNTNMIILNMILMESKSSHRKDYDVIISNLDRYSNDYKGREGIRRKYKYGYGMVRHSPNLYSKFLNFYGTLINSEPMGRRKKLVSQTTGAKATNTWKLL